MPSRQELKRAYQERPKPAGVFQIKHMASGKLLLGSSLNLDGALNRHRFMLSIGGHPNKELQQDWNTFGADEFVCEVLELVKVTEEPHFNLGDELTLLEQIWLEQLQPFGDRGYNRDANIRQV
jgi:hypothetical protein